MRIIIDKNVDVSGTGLCGCFLDGTRYSDLVRVFGEPEVIDDDWKIDVEWRGKISGKVFTIYNYKTGKNYLGGKGLPGEEITDWHIGGKSKKVAAKLVEYFSKKTKQYHRVSSGERSKNNA